MYFLCLSLSFSQDKLCSCSVLHFFLSTFSIPLYESFFSTSLFDYGPVIFPFLLSSHSVAPLPLYRPLPVPPLVSPMTNSYQFCPFDSLLFLYSVSSTSQPHTLLSVSFLLLSSTFFPFPSFLPPIFLTPFLVSLLLSRCRKTRESMEIMRSCRCAGCEDRCRAGYLGQVHINTHYWAQVQGRDQRCMEGSLQVSLGFPPGQV